MTRARTYATIAAGLTALLLSILDQTIVASAAAPIARDLRPAGGAGQIPWLIAAYLLASTCVQPLYGRLADRFGPRIVFLTTLGLFLAGSALCAAAASLGELIAFRAVQGLGGGGLMAVTIVALGHLRRQADDAGASESSNGNVAAAALVGIGLVLGPTIGGQIVEHLSWRWVFLVNLPLGGVAWLAAWWGMRLRARGEPARIDVLGAALLALATAAVLLGCQWGGHRLAWGSWQIVGLGAVTVAALAAFAARQLTAPEPLFPARVLALRDVRTIGLLQLLVGLGTTGSAVYMTIELQLVHGISPAGTGVRLLPMAAGLAVGSLLGRRLLSDLSTLTRGIALSSLLAAGAFAALAALPASAPYWSLALLLGLLGAGNGVGIGSEVIALQRIVSPGHLGIATAGVRFVESLGGSLAAAGLGVLFAGSLHGSSATAVGSAVRPVFIVCAVVMTIAAAVAMRMPLRGDEPALAARPPAAAGVRGHVSRRTARRSPAHPS